MASWKKIRRSIQYGSAYWFVRFLMWISVNISRTVWLALCGWLGSVAYYVAGKTRRLTTRHLTLAFPEKTSGEIKQLAKRTFKMLGKNAGDIFRSTRTVKSFTDIDRIMISAGIENVDTALAKGKGVIFVSCHIGAFDLQVVNMAMRGYKPNVVGTPLKDKRLNDLLWEYRNAYGAVAVQRGKETFRMIKVLKSGGLVALLIDQDTKVQSVFVDFFGMPASTPVGASVLAMKTGAAVLPAYCYLDENNMHRMTIFPELPMRVTDNEQSDLVYNTQRLTSLIEEWIRKHPDQWVWMHERWKTKPDNSN